jgi:hypothetical protein
MYKLSIINGPSPSRIPFPLPYADNFDDAPLNGEANYLTNQADAFEIIQNGGGKLMRQMMVQQPVS